MSEPTYDQYRMARCLNLDPRNPSDWPMEIIDRMVELERKMGSAALSYATIELARNWDTIIDNCRAARASSAALSNEKEKG